MPGSRSGAARPSWRRVTLLHPLLGLLLLLLVGGLAPRPSSSVDLPVPEFHTVWRLDSAMSVEQHANIQFCDFYSQRRLTIGGPDGYDDIAYTRSFYSVRTSPEGKRRSDFAGERPMRFLPGIMIPIFCFTDYPFVRGPVQPISVYSKLLTNALDAFDSLVYVSTSAILLSERNVAELPIGGYSPAMIYDSVSPPRMAPHLLTLYGSRVHLKPLQDNIFSSDLTDNFGLAFPHLLAATDLDGDGQVDAVTTGTLPLDPNSPYSIYWLHNIGRSTTGSKVSDISLLYRLPAGFVPQQIVVGDFDGDGLATDLAVVSGATSTIPEQVVFILSSSLSSPVHLSLEDMTRDDPALASIPLKSRWPKVAVAPKLLAPGHSSLIVAHGSRVWLVPGPILPVKGQVSHVGLRAVKGAPLLPDFPSTEGVWYSVATGDYDGDGRLDLALAHKSSGANVMLLSQVPASPSCLCGPNARCIPSPEGFFAPPSCECLDPHAGASPGLAPCEFCHTGFYRVGDGPCQACHESCATCTGPLATACSSCPEGKALQQGACVSPGAPEVIVTLDPPSQPFFDATVDGHFALPGASHSVASAFWSGSPIGVLMDMVETHMRLRLDFIAHPSGEGVDFFSGYDNSGSVAFSASRLGGGYRATTHPTSSLSSRPLIKYNQKIPMMMNARNLLTCAESSLSGRCQRMQENIGWDFTNITLGRVVGEEGPEAMLRVHLGPQFGSRAISNTTISSVHWAAVDNDFGIETMVVLNHLPAGQTDCELLWYPFQSFDILHLPALPAETLIPRLPCGMLVPLLPSPGQRPSFLLIPRNPTTATAATDGQPALPAGGLVFLLRNVASGSDFRPNFLPALPLLTFADLGYGELVPPSALLSAASDPLVMDAGRARIFLWSGDWLHRVDVRFDDQAPRTHSVAVNHQPLVPRRSFQAFAGGPVEVVVLDVENDGQSEVVLLNGATRVGAIFRQASPSNGCGCGEVGRCTKLADWDRGALCPAANLSTSPGGGAGGDDDDDDDAGEEVDGHSPVGALGCSFLPTGLLVEDLCECAQGFHTPGPEAELCSQCSSESGAPSGSAGVSDTTVAGLTAGTEARCSSCSIDGCQLCQNARCMLCDPGLLITEKGLCASRCDIRDAPVEDGKCHAIGPQDTWLAAQHFHVHADWMAMNMLQASRMRVLRSSEGDMAPMLSISNFLHLSSVRPEDGQQEEWFISAGQLLPNAQYIEPRSIRLADAHQFMRGFCKDPLTASSTAGAAMSPGPSPSSGLLDASLSASILPLLLPGQSAPEGGILGRTSAGVPPTVGGLAALVTGASAQEPTWDNVKLRHLTPYPKAIHMPWFSQLQEPPPVESIGTASGPHPPGLAKQALSQMNNVITMVLSIEAGPAPADIGFGGEAPLRLCDIHGRPLAPLSHLATSMIQVRELTDTRDFAMSECRIRSFPLPYPEEEVFLRPAIFDSGFYPQGIQLVRVPAGSGPGAQQDLLLVHRSTLPLDDTSAFGQCDEILVEVSPPAPSRLPWHYSTANALGLGLGVDISIVLMDSVRDIYPAHPVQQPGLLMLLDSSACIWLLDPADQSITNTVVTLLDLGQKAEIALVRADGRGDSIVLMDLGCISSSRCQSLPIADDSLSATSAAGGSGLGGSGSIRDNFGCPMHVLEHEPITEDVILRRVDVNGDDMMDYVLLYPGSGRLVAYLVLTFERTSFRRVVMLPGKSAPAGVAAAPGKTDILLTDVDQDGHVDVLLFEQSSDPDAPSTFTIFGRSDQTSGWCPPGVDFDPATSQCSCLGLNRFISPLSDACECIQHAVPAGPGAQDCVCPSGMTGDFSACICQVGLLPVANEATGVPVTPPRCDACHGSCASCSATRPGMCASCRPGELLQAGTCVAGCSPGFALSQDLRQCLACAAGCAACNGPSASQCTACSGNRFLPGNVPGRCQPCDAACAGCDGLTARDCKACAPGWLRAPSGECVRTCPEGTSISAPGSNQCQPCADAGCLSCVTAQPGAICRLCQAGLQIDATGKRCLQCHETCATCDGNGPGDCLTCGPGLLLSGSSCVGSCPAGTFANGSSCDLCSGRCATCSGPLSTECLSCPTDWLLQEDGSCLPDPCPTCEACIDVHCESCSPTNPGLCVICAAGKLLLPDGTCADACPSAMYLSPSGDACLPCHGSCAECSSHRASSCTACPGSNVLDRGYCRAACPSLGYFQQDRTCQACDATCLSCTGPGPGQCDLCPRARLSHDSHCLDSCPDSSTPLHGECIGCDASCASCSGPAASQCTACASDRPSLWQSACLETCPMGTFPGQEANVLDTCMSCSPYCQSCAGPEGTQCSECLDGLLLHPAYGCVGICGAGYLAQGGRCVSCDATCHQCQDSADYCTQCPAGKLLGTTAGTCVSRCGDREFADLTVPLLARCAACHPDCASCMHGSRPENCTACPPGLFLMTGVGCVGQCPTGYFAAEDLVAGTQVCLPCVAGCAACTGAAATQCTRCMDDRLLMVESGDCRPAGEDTCPTGWHTDQAKRHCLRCPSGCLSCPGSPGDCEECGPGMQSIRLLDREATDASPIGTGPRTCVAECPGGWYTPEPAADMCSACDAACITCTGPGPDGCLQFDCGSEYGCPGRSGRSILILAIVLPVVLGLILLLVLMYFAMRRARNSAKDSMHPASFDNPENMTVLNTLVELALPGYLLMTSGTDFRIESGAMPLGEGSQAQVLPCTLLNQDAIIRSGASECAIKMLKEDVPHREQLEMLLDQEISILSALRDGSPNVCHIVGFCNAPFKGLIMVSYPGVLSDLLRVPDEPLLAAEFIPNIAMQIADGLKYIHSQNIIHRDLKPQNIFIRPDPVDSRRLQPIIGDFGVAQVLSRATAMGPVAEIQAASAPYAPPEILLRMLGRSTPGQETPDADFLLAGDVYSLGVVLFALVVEGGAVWRGLSPEVVADHVVAGHRPDVCPTSGSSVPLRLSASSAPAGGAPWLESYLEVVRRAWSADPMARPSAAGIHHALSMLH